MSGQRAFADALLRPDAPVPPGMVNPDGSAASKRFDVYRNNVAVSLTEALETAFPAIRKLVGDDFFRAMAGVYLRQHLPKSPLMMFYGAEMPTFLADFAPAKSLPYLADVARLELALRHAYHAADATPIDPAALIELPEESLAHVAFTFAPAVTLLSSPYPVHGIWAAQMQAAPAPAARAEGAMISRPEFDPLVDPLSPEQAQVLAALQRGVPLGDAIRAADPHFDIAALLSLLLARQAITSFTIKETAR